MRVIDTAATPDRRRSHRPKAVPARSYGGFNDMEGRSRISNRSVPQPAPGHWFIPRHHAARTRPDGDDAYRVDPGEQRSHVDEPAAPRGFHDGATEGVDGERAGPAQP